MNNQQGETSYANNFGRCRAGGFRYYAEPCGLLHEPTTKRCRIVEERPASPGVGVVIGGAGFGVRTEAESRMRTVEECREVGTTGGTTVIEERERRPTR